MFEICLLPSDDGIYDTVDTVRAFGRVLAVSTMFEAGEIGVLAEHPDFVEHASRFSGEGHVQCRFEVLVIHLESSHR